MDDKAEAEPSLLNGYPKLASRISQKPELSIFRRFLSLNTENLLYMQAELAVLELELRDIVNEDLHSGLQQRRKHSTSFLALQESSEHGKKTQWLKRQKIKEKLKEYSNRDPFLLGADQGIDQPSQMRPPCLLYSYMP
jgi:hypothetical protein